MAKKKPRVGQNADYSRKRAVAAASKTPKAGSPEAIEAAAKRARKVATKRGRPKAGSDLEAIKANAKKASDEIPRGKRRKGESVEAYNARWKKQTENAVAPKVPKKRKSAKRKANSGRLADLEAIARRSEKLRVQYEEEKTKAREALQAWNACRDQLVRETIDCAEQPGLFDEPSTEEVQAKRGGAAGVVDALYNGHRKAKGGI